MEKEIIEKEIKNRKKINFMKWRLVIILTIFFVITPIVLLIITAIFYNVESHKMEIKLNDNVTLKYNTRNFSKYSNYTTGSSDFEALVFNVKKSVHYYQNETEQKEQNERRRVGFGTEIETNIVLKYNENFDYRQKTQIIYALFLPFSTNKKRKESGFKEVVFEKKEHAFYDEDKKQITPFKTTIYASNLRMKAGIPHKIPFYKTIKKPLCYVIIRIPYLRQDKIEHLKRINPKPENAEIEKLREYREFLYFIDLEDKATDKKHELW